MADLIHALRRASQHQTARGTGRRGVVPAPTLGLNTQDNVASMHPQYAVELLNFFPQRGRLTTRRGCTEYADIRQEKEIGTLAAHLSGNVDSFYAWTDDAVWDITDPDSPSQIAGAVVTNNRWRTAALGPALIAVNGVDEPLRLANGAATAHGFTGTGLTASRLTALTAHHRRLFFGDGSSKLWYSELGSITGALSPFDVGLTASGAGNIQALGSLTLDSGSGVDDLLAIYMTSGLVFLYAGTDPSDAANWRQAGAFQVGQAIGPDPLVSFGADLVAITHDGLQPLLSYIQTGRRESQKVAVSAKIAPSISDDVRDFGAEPGWQGVLHTPSSWVLFNVPLRDRRYRQYVMNSETGAWCVFEGWQSACWGVRGDRIYFGTHGGKVIQADAGGDDCGSSFPARARSAFNYLGSPYEKQFTLIRAHTETSALARDIQVGVSTDFSFTTPQITRTALSRAGTPWGASANDPLGGLWDTFDWGAAVARDRTWRPLSQSGSAVSVFLAAESRGDELSLFSTDVVYNQTATAAAAPSDL